MKWFNTGQMMFLSQPVVGLDERRELISQCLARVVLVTQVRSIRIKRLVPYLVPGRDAFAFCEQQELVKDGPIALLGRGTYIREGRLEYTDIYETA